MDKKDLLKETRDLLIELLTCGDFYQSAIELDLFIGDRSVDGEEIEKRMEELLKKIEDEI